MKHELQILINDCKNDLDDIKNRIQSTSPFDKIRVYLTQYSLIRACGTAEYVYRSVVADYFNKYSDPKIDTYIEKTVRTGSMSAKYDKMSELLGRFDDDWKKSFQRAAKDHKDFERLKTSAESLVNSRHAFAHGKNTTITFNDIYSYYEDVLTLINILDDVVEGRISS